MKQTGCVKVTRKSYVSRGTGTWKSSGLESHWEVSAVGGALKGRTDGLMATRHPVSKTS